LRWKTANKPFMLELLRVWLADENAIVRQKLFAMSVKHVTPLLAEIIRQGIREGVFTTAYPDQACHVILYVLQGLSETIIELLISSQNPPAPTSIPHPPQSPPLGGIEGGAGGWGSEGGAARIEHGMTVYIAALTDALERVLGTPPGALHLVDPETLKEWFVSKERDASLVPHSA
jgi:hypothetical protein